MSNIVIEIATDRVKWGEPIPESDGIKGGNERCIEWPLGLEAMACEQPGWVLDAGCAMVRPLVSVPDHLMPVANVVHLTQAIADEPIHPRGQKLSFVSADLRDLRIFSSGAFDRVVCVSTLEHVGFDNSQYGGSHEYEPLAWMDAFRELWRVTRGTLLVTVPFHHVAESSTKWQYFYPWMAEYMTLSLDAHDAELAFYARGANGWYGGGPNPLKPELVDFPQRVNQIVCLRASK